MSRRVAMHVQPQRTLKRLVKQYGHELLDDPRRTEALLRDLCGQYPREIFVLVNAQKQRVPAELLAAPKWMPAAATHTRLSKLLQTKLAVTEAAADWAVSAWAAALDVDSLPAERERFNWLPAAIRPTVDPTARRPGAKRRQQTDSGVKSSEQSRGQARRRASQAQRAELRGWRAAWAWLWPPDWHGLFGALAQAVAALSRPGILRTGAISVALVSLSALLLWLATTLAQTPLYGDAYPAPLAEDAGAAVTPVLVEMLTAPTPTWDATQALPAEYLRTTFPTPTLARVAAADGLFVREGPDTSFARAGHVALNEVVTVIGYSDDGAWSNIDRPQGGWVSNEYLHFESQAAIGVRVQLRVRQLEIRPYQAALRAAPRPDAAVVATLPPSSPVIAVASTVGANVGWLQIAAPVSGWLSLNDIP